MLTGFEEFILETLNFVPEMIECLILRGSCDAVAGADPVKLSARSGQLFASIELTLTGQ